MSRLHTHYENLKVAHDAPPEVIRAAYRALAQRYHPDVNPSPDAARIMTMLNEGYAVLSDPKQRAAHDAWIEDQFVKEALEPATVPILRHHDARRVAWHHTGGHDEGPGSSRERHQPNPLVRLNHWLGTATGTKYGVRMVAGAFILGWLWLTKTPMGSPYDVSRVTAPGPSAMQSHEPPRTTLSFEEGARDAPPSGGPRAAAFDPWTAAPVRSFNTGGAVALED